MDLDRNTGTTGFRSLSQHLDGHHTWRQIGVAATIAACYAPARGSDGWPHDRLALVVAAVLILQAAGLKRRSPGSLWQGFGLIIGLLMIAIFQLSNDHDWTYRQRYALHQLALVPMIIALVLITVGTVRQIQAVSRG